MSDHNGLIFRQTINKIFVILEMIKLFNNGYITVELCNALRAKVSKQTQVVIFNILFI